MAQHKQRTGKGSSGKRGAAATDGKRPNWFSILVVAAFVVALVFVALTFWDPDGSESELDKLTAFKKNGELTFVAASGEELHSIDIEIADTESRRSVGLMYRKELDDTEGMLFVFPEQTDLTFWMHNTPVSIDMIFADSSGRINTIYNNAQPFDESQYPSAAPAEYVVEVAAGFAERYRIFKGDSIRWHRTSPDTTTLPGLSDLPIGLDTVATGTADASD